MPRFSQRLAALVLVPIAFAMAGCSGNSAGPSPLVQQNVNGTYKFTATGAATDPLLFTADLKSGDPVQNQGADYYSEVTGTIVNAPAMNLGSCAGSVITLSGKITNPDHVRVYLNATGTTPGNGTMTITGTVPVEGQTLGNEFIGTLKIDGGSCPLASTNYNAKH